MNPWQEFIQHIRDHSEEFNVTLLTQEEMDAQGDSPEAYYKYEDLSTPFIVWQDSDLGCGIVAQFQLLEDAVAFYQSRPYQAMITDMYDNVVLDEEVDNRNTDWVHFLRKGETDIQFNILIDK